MYCRTGRRLLNPDFTAIQEQLVQLCSGYGGWGPLVPPEANMFSIPLAIYTQRKTVMNDLVGESLRYPIVKKPVYQLNLLTLKKD